MTNKTKTIIRVVEANQPMKMPEALDLKIGKFELDFYTDNDTPARKLARKIIPLFDGYTPRQVELALKDAMGIFNGAYTIRLRHLPKKTKKTSSN